MDIDGGPTAAANGIVEATTADIAPIKPHMRAARTPTSASK
jgi:hypothetical protein